MEPTRQATSHMTGLPMTAVTQVAACRATNWSMTSSRVEALAPMARASGLSRSVILPSNPFPY